MNVYNNNKQKINEIRKISTIVAHAQSSLN